MAAQQLKPFLYRYYNGIIYQCRRVTHGNSRFAVYSACSLPPGITIEQFAPEYVQRQASTEFYCLEFHVGLLQLSRCTIFYPSKTACKVGAGRVFTAMLKEPGADKEYIHEQINKIQKVKIR